MLCSESDLSVFVQYIALYHDTLATAWPTNKNKVFWDRCDVAVAKTYGLQKRAGKHALFIVYVLFTCI